MCAIMPVNTYKFNTVNYWCCECVKNMPETVTIKRSSVETALIKYGKFYNKNTVSNALLQLASDGRIKRESTNIHGETIYIKCEAK